MSAPLYIVSKGRADSRMTHRALVQAGLPHYVVVEEQEAETYRRALDPLGTVLVLDRRFQEEYETCDAAGLTKSVGPGAARNFAWSHALAAGARWHWVMDDNIVRFYRLHQNRKIQANTPAIFEAMEDFCDRYENVVMAGPQYESFALRRAPYPAYVANTRIYSCNLIRNDLPFRWRGRYNEDTDLSLRILKAGFVTIQFNAFLQNKVATQRVAGGNTAEFYAHEGTRPKSEMLAQLHPDVARVVEKWGRIHHEVDYSPYARNRLRRRADRPLVPAGDNEFGMRLEHCGADGVWRQVTRPAPLATPVFVEGK